jgi:hypothetical protein
MVRQWHGWQWHDLIVDGCSTVDRWQWHDLAWVAVGWFDSGWVAVDRWQWMGGSGMI